jgi:hypothetical protein
LVATPSTLGFCANYLSFFKGLLYLNYQPSSLCLLGIVQLENYSKTEEAKVEELIKAVADSGAKIIVSGAAVGEMALHFCERYKYAICITIVLIHNIDKFANIC